MFSNYQNLILYGISPNGAVLKTHYPVVIVIGMHTGEWEPEAGRGAGLAGNGTRSR